VCVCLSLAGTLSLRVCKWDKAGSWLELRGTAKGACQAPLIPSHKSHRLRSAKDREGRWGVFLTQNGGMNATPCWLLPCWRWRWQRSVRRCCPPPWLQPPAAQVCKKVLLYAHSESWEACAAGPLSSLASLLQCIWRGVAVSTLSPR